MESNNNGVRFWLKIVAIGCINAERYQARLSIISLKGSLGLHILL
jgi:hypothetical protein